MAKVIAKPKGPRPMLSVRVRPETLELVKRHAEQYGVPVQRLVDAILHKALSDKNFVVKVER